MSKIYDALENAQKTGNAAADVVKSEVISSSTEGVGESLVDMEEEMIALYQSISTSLPGVEHPSVMFLGSRSNEGTSTVARELARTVSLRLEKTVLLIDLDRSRLDMRVFAHLRPEKTMEEVVHTGESIEKTMCRVEESSLYVMPLFQRTIITPKTLDSAKKRAFWDPIREKFDLIVVDCPPATMFPDGPAIVSQVDGVVLVVEAEKTRWQVALSVKEKVIKSGGRILGIVFNRQRHYIPQWIYNRL